MVVFPVCVDYGDVLGVDSKLKVLLGVTLINPKNEKKVEFQYVCVTLLMEVIYLILWLRVSWFIVGSRGLVCSSSTLGLRGRHTEVSLQTGPRKDIYR